MTELFVATTGKDSNPGTKAKPMATVQAAANKLGKGGTITVRGGNYYQQMKIANEATKDKPLLIRAYAGEFPVIDGRAGQEHR